MSQAISSQSAFGNPHKEEICIVPLLRVQLEKQGKDVSIFKVILTKQAQRDLKRVPLHIVRKLLAWVDDIENTGLYEVRKEPGYHDEPLKGNRAGQRSIRLSKGYRAIYMLGREGKIEVIKVLEVNKHDY